VRISSYESVLKVAKVVRSPKKVVSIIWPWRHSLPIKLIILSMIDLVGKALTKDAPTLI